MNKVTSVNHQEASLEDYQQEILEIWPPLASRPALHTWARVVQHSTVACEGMRRNNWGMVLKEMTKTTVWWLAFIQKLNLIYSSLNDRRIFRSDFMFGMPLSATEIVWLKYPGVCPVEFGLAPSDSEEHLWATRPAQICSCLAKKAQVEQRSHEEKARAKELLKRFATKNANNCPKSVCELEKMTRMIFANPVHTLSLEELFFHFIEEIGEVSEALANATVSECLRHQSPTREELQAERRKKVLSIAEELADVFSWSISIIAKVQSQLKSFEDHIASRPEAKEIETIRNLLNGSQLINITEMIWQEYGLRDSQLRCNECHERPCNCSHEKALPLFEQTLRDIDPKTQDLVFDVFRDFKV